MTMPNKKAKFSDISQLFDNGWVTNKGTDTANLISPNQFAFSIKCSRAVYTVINDTTGQKRTMRSLQEAADWISGMNKLMCAVDNVYVKHSQNAVALNSNLSAEAATRIKTVFKTAQDAVDLPKGFRYTAFRTNSEENVVISTLMYTSAKLGATQWVMKSGLMGAFEGEIEEGRRNDVIEHDSWAFQPDYDINRVDSGKEDYIEKEADKIYNFRPTGDTPAARDKQAAYWLVGLLSDVLDNILDNPPNRVYEFFLADGLLHKKDLSRLTMVGLLRLLDKGAVTGPEVLKAKPSIWKKLLEKGYITPEQALKSQPEQLAWLTIHNYIPVERALKIDPSITKKLARAGITIDEFDNSDILTDVDSLIGYVTDGVLTPQKAWTLNDKVLRPLVEQGLIAPDAAYKLDPSILNWLLENHYIGREEATRLKPTIKKEMTRKGVDWETLEASKNLNSAWEDIEPSWHDTYPDEVYGDDDDDYEDEWEPVSDDVINDPDGQIQTTTYFNAREGIYVLMIGDEAPSQEHAETYSTDLSDIEYYIQDWNEQLANLDSSKNLNAGWDYNDYIGWYDPHEQEQEEIDNSWSLRRYKTYIDSEGWQGEYYWFYNTMTGEHIFMADSDEPDPDYADWTTESEEEAAEWFDNYGNDDLDSSRELNCSYDYRWEYIAERWVDDNGVDRHYTLYGDDTAHRYIITYDDGEEEVEPSEDNAIEMFRSYKEAKNYLNDLDSSRQINADADADLNNMIDSFAASEGKSIDQLDKIKKRISWIGEFDNGRVLHGDWARMSVKDAEEKAKEASLAQPDKVFYVSYDNVMIGSSDIRWQGGVPRNLRSIDSNAQEPASEAAKIALENQIRAKVRAVMTGPNFGFSDDEADSYSKVEVSETDDGRVRVEVRADVTYDGLMQLAEALNPIVQKYDKDSYFDAVTSGVIDAYIENAAQKLNSLDFQSTSWTR